MPGAARQNGSINAAGTPAQNNRQGSADMTRLPFLTVALLASCLIAGPLHADLTTLDVQFSPDAETFYQGESFSVQLTTDNGVGADYRYVLQHYQNDDYVTVVDSDWVSDSQYALSTVFADMTIEEGGFLVIPEAPGGIYRLVAYARDPANPGEFIANFQTFVYETESMTVCDYLDGKTFENTQPTIQLSRQMQHQEAVESLGTQGYQVSLGSDAAAIERISFSGGSVSIVLAEAPELVMPLNGTALLEPEGPLTGTYECDAAVVTLEDVRADALSGGFLSVVDASGAFIVASGDGSVNVEAGTVTAGGVVFSLQSDNTAVNPDSSGSGAGGVSGLLMLVVLGWLRRLRY
jgi:hypothetical protein